ncbi:MAG: BrnT family toxin [Burkholderiaceae bacterium]
MDAIEYDPAKRAKTLEERGLDFEDASILFASADRLTIDMTKLHHGEQRLATIGFLRERLTLVVWTPRGSKRRIISMRIAHESERIRYYDNLG